MKMLQKTYWPTMEASSAWSLYQVLQNLQLQGHDSGGSSVTSDLRVPPMSRSAQLLLVGQGFFARSMLLQLRTPDAEHPDLVPPNAGGSNVCTQLCKQGEQYMAKMGNTNTTCISNCSV